MSTHKKLEWRCSKGHTWKAIPGSVMKGTWCPVCGRKKGDLARRLTIEEMREIALQRGGECLSAEFINTTTNLSWKCKEGHIWEAAPSNIKSGKWCPYCAGKYQTIEDMTCLAEERGGECLSEKYINNTTKLKWKCSKGHVWEDTPSHVKSGRWCSDCSRARRSTLKVNRSSHPGQQTMDF